MTEQRPDVIDRLLRDTVASVAKRFRIPTATYRLQMHHGFTLRDALRIVPYLDHLGISHLYLSSILTARPGSLHGYDVVDHRHLNPEIGTAADLQALADELHRRGMGMIIDVVPNHMWIGEGNVWWMDVLENGQDSRFADYFDIAWGNHPRKELHGKVLLPILDAPIGKAIKAHRLRPLFESGRFQIAIDQARFPVAPRTYPIFLEPVLETMRERDADDAPLVLELQSILTAIRNLPTSSHGDSSRSAELLAETTVIKRRVRELAEASGEVEALIQAVVNEIAGADDPSADFKRLIELLEAQHYRPCFWRVALDEINYRRFFDINDLAALAAERMDVFQAIHAQAFEWLQQGIVDGLRIDHVDGLLDPKVYLDRLQQQFLLTSAKRQRELQSDQYDRAAWDEIESGLRARLAERWPIEPTALYVVIEKILGPRESIPDNWICHGTTGYEFTNEVNGLFIDSQQALELTDVYERFTGQEASFDQIAYASKLQILRTTMASELSVLAHRLDRLAHREWWSQDFTLNGLRQALEEIIASFPIYRTYVASEPSPSDRIYILRAARYARKHSPLLGKEIFDFICDTLLLRVPEGITVSPDYQDDQRQFAGKFQQLTSPIMAKGVEDTTLYIFNRLISLNEVGGTPDNFGRTPQDLNSFFTDRATYSPHGLSPLSTHDTKRSEDVRARINVLSEMPQEWERRIQYWRQLNRPHKRELEDGLLAPDDNEEYFLYQTLVGAWPDHDHSGPVDDGFVRRMQAYMTKASREAKVNSSWIYPELNYDNAVTSFIQQILNPTLAATFLDDLRAFQRKIARLGKLNSLSQTLIRCTAPGVPDTYQGTESWDDSVVDPDNRRPVDYDARIAMLDRILELQATAANRSEAARQIIQSDSAKLFVTTTSLKLRRVHAPLFTNGDYIPLHASGDDANHVFGFLRTLESEAILVCVPRLVAALASQHAGDDSQLPTFHIAAELALPKKWENPVWVDSFTGTPLRSDDGKISASKLFADLPIAFLYAGLDQ